KRLIACLPGLNSRVGRPAALILIPLPAQRQGRLLRFLACDFGPSPSNVAENLPRAPGLQFRRAARRLASECRAAHSLRAQPAARPVNPPAVSPRHHLDYPAE